MSNWVREILGIKRYAISHDYPVKGAYTGIGGRRMSKFVAKQIVKDMNEIHGPGTHWVVPLHD